MDGRLTITFFDSNPPSYTETIDTTATVCEELGFSIDGSSDSTIEYNTKAIEAQYSNENGIWLGPISIFFSIKRDDWTISSPILTVGVNIDQITPKNNQQADEDSEAAGIFFEFVRRLALDLDPLYVASIDGCVESLDGGGMVR